MTEDNGPKEGVKDAVFRCLAAALRAVPLWVEAIGAGAFLAAVIQRNPALKERLRELDNKVFLFEASDIGKGFYLLIKEGEINVIPHMSSPPHVTMKGEVRVLIDVFLGHVDPDTVFFSRKLEISGDTATAIHLKNILAALL
ncbi:MAG: SCP2 sterol-binding domain-containing protein [Deltaproteobacteria bacterium]|nr:SCP2 sterol-binding domain-containing protein [Deltaproteobacteria bacterium]